MTIVDVAIPHAENWRFATEQLRPIAQAHGCRIAYTTTNKRVLDGLVGETPAIEVLGKPCSYDDVLKLVRWATEAEARPSP